MPWWRSRRHVFCFMLFQFAWGNCDLRTSATHRYLSRIRSSIRKSHDCFLSLFILPYFIYLFIYLFIFWWGIFGCWYVLYLIFQFRVRYATEQHVLIQLRGQCLRSYITNYPFIIKHGYAIYVRLMECIYAIKLAMITDYLACDTLNHGYWWRGSDKGCHDQDN